jgi:hypothetical protein
LGNRKVDKMEKENTCPACEIAKKLRSLIMKEEEKEK